MNPPASPTATVAHRSRLTAGRRSMLLAAALILSLLATACIPGSGDDPVASHGVDLGSAATPATAAVDGAVATAGAADHYSASSTRAVALTDTDLDLFDGPAGSPVGTLAATTEYGTTRVLLAEAVDGDWIRVRLPRRPNHTSAWVKADDVRLENLKPSVHVDLANRTLTVRVDGTVLAQSTVAVGSSDNPTPLGTFYITDKIETPDPDGAYGPFAFGLSGYSETLTEFAGGDGQIGIHGTDDPASLGQAVSHGCIRLPNEIVTMLADVLPLGTPVHIA